ncbi:MAG: hypothetical protein ACOYMF_14340 [Bacteroidales bacterium]
MIENLCETCCHLDTINCKQTQYPCQNYFQRDIGVLIAYLLLSLVPALLFLLLFLI